MWEVVCAIALLTVITTLVLRQASERPYLLVGWLWFVGTLVPVIGLAQIGGAAMADRYHYVPSIGLFVALVFGLSTLPLPFALIAAPWARLHSRTFNSYLPYHYADRPVAR
jgi:hypothetical protein